jgi:hypothetical protein
MAMLTIARPCKERCNYRKQTESNRSMTVPPATSELLCWQQVLYDRAGSNLRISVLAPSSATVLAVTSEWLCSQKDLYDRAGRNLSMTVRIENF